MLDLDEALERFHLTRPEYRGGLANHGPMACEALGALGHPVLRMAFVDLYAPRLSPLAPGRAIPVEEQAIALGRPERTADWIATLERELTETPWTAVLERRVSDWCEGLFAGAGHGWLRTAHAVRALDAQTNEIRLRELAHGLGYWAACHQRLPGNPGEQPARLSPAQLIDHTPLVPERERHGGLFTRSVLALEGLPDFGRAVDALDTEVRDPSRAVHELCVRAAELYLAHPEQRVAYVHALTIPSALRMLVSHLEPQTARRALSRAAQTASALHAVSGTEAAKIHIDSAVEKLAEDSAEIRYRAACSLEEHAIKLAEAALRENAVHPHRSLQLAAADAALHLSPTGRC